MEPREPGERSNAHVVSHDNENWNQDKDLDVEHVRAPNIFERVKEEIEAITQTIHEKHAKTKQRMIGHAEQGVSPTGDTHLPHDDDGMGSHIDDLALEEVKAPNIFERAKEEIEAITHTINEKYDNKKQQSYVGNDTSGENGCWPCMGKTFEKICGGAGN
eukprot:c26663_g2_i1 orf=221-700(-)